MDNREADSASHPPACTCWGCCAKRLGRAVFRIKPRPPHRTQRLGRTVSPVTTSPKRSGLPKWLSALLLLLILSIVGAVIAVIMGSPIPLWLFLGFAIVYSIQKWFTSITRIKVIGILYRILLNLGVLSVFGYTIWFGVQVFSKQLAHSPLTGSLIFAAEIIFFIWLWRIVSKNRWRWPSMKLTVFFLLCLFIVFAFAGVEPASTYKDTLFAKWDTYQAEREIEAEERLIQAEADEQKRAEERLAQAEIEEQRIEAEEQAGGKSTVITVVVPPTIPPMPTMLEIKPILCDPTWEELKAFLLKDNTDEIEYVYPTMVCADFADRVQNNAKAAGWRCAVVSLRTTGYDDPFNFGISSDAGHACNAFETTDQGLVYIDCTGWVNGVGPLPADRLATLEIGKRQINQFIFPSGGWINVSNVSIIRSIDITW